MTALLKASGLLRKSTEDESLLLKTISQPFLADGRFPFFDYVESILYAESLDAAALLRSLPSVGSRGLYGWIRYCGERNWNAQDLVQLTVAGLAQCAETTEEVTRFVSALRFMVDRERQHPPKPHEIQRVDAASQHIEMHLRSAGFSLPSPALPQLRALLEYEPWGGVGTIGGAPDEWTVTLTKGIRVFRDVESLDDYLQRVVARVAPPTPLQLARPLSSLSLPEAMDYLDAVWELHVKRRLFQFRSAKSLVELTHSCGTEEELKSRLSAFCDVMDRMEIPRVEGDGSLNRLERFIGAEFKVGAPERVSSAIDRLRAMVTVRAGKQHSGARAKELRAYARLGITYPPPGWDIAWSTMQAHAVDAFNSLREEIQRAGGTSGSADQII